jgi:c-di-GMP-binding flagellar brake protein YcgR
MSSQPRKALKGISQRRRRRYPRYHSELPVIVTLLAGEERQRLEAHCRDLSETGIGVLLAAELNLGEVVSLGFSIPGTPHAWNIQAVLRHRRGYHYGFEFFSLSDEQRRILTEYLAGLKRSDTDQTTP